LLSCVGSSVTAFLLDSTSQRRAESVPYVIGFLAGILVALLTNYLTWMSEIRRKALDAVLDFYGAMISATEDVSEFIAQWGGLGRIEFGYNPEAPNRPEVTAFWKTRGKLLELRMRIDRVAIFVGQDTRDLLVAEWKHLWDGFHASGADPKKDLKFHEEMRKPSEQVALLVRKGFMSWRGFSKSVLGG
jgi:hypothetical protein